MFACKASFLQQICFSNWQATCCIYLVKSSRQAYQWKQLDQAFEEAGRITVNHFLKNGFNKPLLTPVYSVLQIRFMFRTQFKLLPQIRCLITLRIESSIISTDRNITNNNSILAILSDTTVRRSAVDQEDLKPYWKSEKRPHFSR